MKILKSIIIELAVIISIFSIVVAADLVDIQVKNSSQNLKNIQDVSLTLYRNKKQLYDLGNDIIATNVEILNLKKDIQKNLDKQNIWNNEVIKYNNKLKERNEKIKVYNRKLDEYYNEYNKYEASNSFINWIKFIIGID